MNPFVNGFHFFAAGLSSMVILSTKTLSASYLSGIRIIYIKILT